MTPDKSASDARELLSCPFCGAEAQTLLRGYYYAHDVEQKEPAKKGAILCPTCEVRAPESTWNTRASPAPQGGERDETAELRLLIEEYRPSNHDWGFRKSVILDVLSRIELRSPAVSANEWQPIETFPKNEEDYLACDNRVQGGFYQVVFYDPDTGMLGVPDARIAYQPTFFTHWKRLDLTPTDASHIAALTDKRLPLKQEDGTSSTVASTEHQPTETR